VDPIALLDIRDTPLDVGEVYASVLGRDTGGVSLFVGTVRDHDGGRAVAALEYSAHPTAQARLREVVDEVVAQHSVRRVAAVHRTGPLEIGDIAVIVAVASAHRGDAFVACRQLIDELKARVPIWKRQLFVDGDEEWVGTP
jgi:molybdopterin synthase catalytic subunit